VSGSEQTQSEPRPVDRPAEQEVARSG